MSILNDIYGGDWLKPDDLGQHQSVKVHISGWFIDEKEDRRNPGQMQKQIVLQLHKTDKKFGLNKTNAEAIAAWYGPDPNQWVNQPINIRQEWALAFGEQKLVLRVNPPMPGQGYGQQQSGSAAPPGAQQGFQQPAPPPPQQSGGTVPPPAGYPNAPPQQAPDADPFPSANGAPPASPQPSPGAPGGQEPYQGVKLPDDDMDSDIPF